MDGQGHERDERADTHTNRYAPDPGPDPDSGAADSGGIPDSYGSYRDGRFGARAGDETAERSLPADLPTRPSPHGPPPGYHQANFGPSWEAFGQSSPSAPHSPPASAEPPPYDSPPADSSRFDLPRYSRPSYGEPATGEMALGRPGYGSRPGYGTQPGYGSGGWEPSQEPQGRESLRGEPFHHEPGRFDSTAVIPRTGDAGGEAPPWHTGRASGRDGAIVPVGGRRRAVRDSDDDEDEDRKESHRRTMPLWQELPLLLVVAFCLAVLIRTFLLQAFYIPSGSMENTLLVGDRVLVNKIVYDVRTPERGEVIVFRGTDNWAPENPAEPTGSLLGRVGRTLGDLVGVSRPGEKDFIKRVIGLPGDRISCCDGEGRVYVNGRPIDEPYVEQNSPVEVEPDPRVCRSRRFDEVVVPPGQLFVMGDHRIVSQDSRCQGTVPIENVIGRAFVVVWPSSRWDTLSVPDTFADVPGPVALGPPGARLAGGPELLGGAVTLPLLASLVVTARRGRGRAWLRRTLRK